jgi:LysR family cys regulon transcriptional activator
MNVTRVAIKRGAYLRSFVYTFLELLSDKLNRKAVQEAMAAPSQGGH